MATQDEESEVKEFLKRAEIRTMKKDLKALREADALRERDKIVKIKTLEEQIKEKGKTTAAAIEKIDISKVLQKNEGQEKLAEKDLKEYATEQERQQIFLLESQRLELEKQIDAIDKEKDPSLKLDKNKLLLQKRDQQGKLDSIIADEKKLEGEQKVITEREQASTIPAEKKGLEQSKWDLDKKIQDIEKKRWEAEKQMQDTDSKIAETDKSSEGLVAEKNILKDKILGVEKSLREIYSVVMAREEEKRQGKAQEQIIQKEALAEVRSEQKEKIQREQWSPTAFKKSGGFSSSVSGTIKERIMESSKAEEEQRKKFVQDVENWSQDKNQQPKNNISPANEIPVAPRKKS